MQHKVVAVLEEPKTVCRAILQVHLGLLAVGIDTASAEVDEVPDVHSDEGRVLMPSFSLSLVKV